MGGYPSHDAPSFLFATAAHHPSNGTTAEICLVPLTRRYFNDNNRRLKDVVTQLYFPSAKAATGDATTPAHTGSAAAAEGGASAQALKAMDMLLNEIDSSFFTSTRQLYEAASVARAKLEIREAAAAAASAALVEGRDEADKAAPAGEQADHRTTNTAGEKQNSIHSSGAHSGNSNWSGNKMQSPVLRPVPCAICVVEPDVSGRRTTGGAPSTSTGAFNNSNSSSMTGAVGGTNMAAYAAPTTAPEWIGIQGRRLRCIGYISCFSKAPRAAADAATATTTGAAPVVNTALAPVMPADMVAEAAAEAGPKSPFSAEGARPGFTVSLLEECPPEGMDVYLDVVLDNDATYAYLLEPVVFLAGIMFRSQYITCSMLQRSVHSPEVENAYYAHLQMLKVHVQLSKVHVQHLRVLYDQLPLLEYVEEMGLQTRSMSMLRAGGEVASEAALSATDPAELEKVSGDGEAAVPADAEADGEAPDAEADAVAVHAAGAAVDGSEKAEDAASEKEGGEYVEAGTETPVEDRERLSITHEDDDDDEEDEEEHGDMDGTKTSTTDGDRGKTTGNVSASGAPRRTRRSRRRQRRQKVAQSQDEVYRTTRCAAPVVRLYKHEDGDEGVEMVFDGALLARFMKMISETAAYETAKNTYVRCDMGPLMKERRHLIQTRRDSRYESRAHTRVEERVFGGEANVERICKWIDEGHQLEEEAQKAALVLAQTALTAHQPTPLHPSVAAAAATAAAAAAAAGLVQGGIVPGACPTAAESVQAGSTKGVTSIPLNPALAAQNPALAAAAASLGQNPALAHMGMMPAPMQTAAAAAGGAPSMMYMPGMNYLPVAGAAGMSLPTAAAQPHAAQPTYFLHPTTGQPMLMMPSQTPSVAAAAAARGGFTQPQAVSYPSMMPFFNAQQQQQQQQQQPTVMAASPYFGQHAATATTTIPQPQQQAQPHQQYQYMLGPNGQLILVQNVATSSAQLQAQQAQQAQQQYMLAAAQAAQQQQAHGQQQQQIYSYMMAMAAQQQQQQQMQMQQLYIQQLQAQHFARQQQQQQQQQPAPYPFMVNTMQGLQVLQGQPTIAVGNSQISLPSRTPAGTPPQQPGTPPAAPLHQFQQQQPPPLATPYAGLYGLPSQQLPTVTGTAASTPSHSSQSGPKISAAAAAPNSAVHATNSLPPSAGLAGASIQPPTYAFATIQDDDDDDEDEAAALAAATAAMAAIRGHGESGQGNRERADDDDNDDEDDGSQYFSNGQFYFRTQ